MKIEHLEERINEYKTSIQTVIEKRILWDTKIKTQIFQTLKKVENTQTKTKKHFNKIAEKIKEHFNKLKKQKQ